jgi:uncharacterized protein
MTSLLNLLMLIAATAPSANGPTFDCSRATEPVEKTICKDAGLTALDREMGAAWDKAILRWPSEEGTRQKPLQLAWIKTRNGCRKASDLLGCIETRYKERLVEIRILSGQQPAPSLPRVEFTCAGGDPKTFSAVFYNETDPASVDVTYGADRVIAFAAPAASGARYEAPGFELWEHQGEAALQWRGTKRTCRPRSE